MITRPAADAHEFAVALKQSCTADFDVLVSPIMKIEHLPIKTGARSNQRLIFSSVNGVRSAVASNLTRQKCVCVGTTTFELARDNGFEVTLCAHDAKSLLSHLISETSCHYVYIRGQHIQLDMLTELSKVGISCEQYVAYTQTPTPLTAKATALLLGGNLVVLPLFSMRSVLLLRESIAVPLDVNCVAISTRVAKALHELSDGEIWVAETPNRQGMIKATCGMLNHTSN